MATTLSLKKTKLTKQKKMFKHELSKKGVVSRLYSSQRSHSKRRGHNYPSYTNLDLREWLYSQPLFHELHDNWKKSGYAKDLKPSVDRRDDSIGYSIDNIQLTTWRDNNAKFDSDRKAGINNSQSKAVMSTCKTCYKKIEYYSLQQAFRDTNIPAGNISKCCSGVLKSAGGRYWEYVNKGVK